MKPPLAGRRRASRLAGLGWQARWARHAAATASVNGVAVSAGRSAAAGKADLVDIVHSL
jgi:hypothetical protein